MLATACSSIGPATIPRDRFDYGEAIAQSWNEQMLLAIVKLRYFDMPMFVHVSSVINQYALAGNVNAGATFGDAELWTAGAGARFEDRPTITYNPILGTDFTRSLMTPVPPGALLFLMQSGWPVDLLFRTCVQAVNGIYNRGGATTLERHAPDPRFDAIIEGLAEIQRSGSVGLSIEGIEHGEAAVMVVRRTEDARIQAVQAEVRQLLGLSPGSTRFRVTYGSDAEDDANVAMLTRSVFEILMELARQIDVMPQDVEERRTIPTMTGADSPARLIRVQTASDRPDDAFVTVRYRDRWFWIDDRDMFSKRTFAFLVVLFNLTDTGSSSALPLLTVGAN